MNRVYGTNEFNFSDAEPEEVALDFFEYQGCAQGDIVQVNEGEKYTPEEGEELEWMEAESHEYLVKNIKPYMVYGYDEKNDLVYEIDMSQVKEAGE